MSDKQDLGELLREALEGIEAIGSADRARLADLVGRDTYDKLISKPRGADLVDRWEAASAKTKPAAIKALSVAIARTANKPALLDRIQTELHDAFDDGAPTKGQVDRHRAAANQRRNGQRVAYAKPKGTSASMLAELAKSNNVEKYIAARQRKET